MPSAVMVIGLGNRMRGDDAAGLEVIDRLEGEDGFVVRSHEGEAVGLLDLWADAEAVVLVDAVHADLPPGTIHRFDAGARALPFRPSRTSGHAIGVAQAIELARALDALPATVVFYGVEGADFTAGRVISGPVAGAIDSLVALVRAEALGLAQAVTPHRSPQ